VRAAAAHKVKDFCLALDKSIQEQVIMNHLLPCVKVISFFVGLVEFFFLLKNNSLSLDDSMLALKVPHRDIF
jgi:hypothetical protein